MRQLKQRILIKFKKERLKKQNKSSKSTKRVLKSSKHRFQVNYQSFWKNSLRMIKNKHVCDFLKNILIFFPQLSYKSYLRGVLKGVFSALNKKETHDCLFLLLLSVGKVNVFNVTKIFGFGFLCWWNSASSNTLEKFC